MGQASDDARKMMEKAQSNAHSEIEAARATVLRVEASLMEHVESLGIAEKQVCCHFGSLFKSFHNFLSPPQEKIKSPNCILTQFSVCYNSINWVWSSLELQNERFFVHVNELEREREREREREIFSMCIGM
jgi:hypothetical protein